MFYAQSTSTVIHQSEIVKRVRNFMFYAQSTLNTVIHRGEIVKRVSNLMFYAQSTSTVTHQSEIVKRVRNFMFYAQSTLNTVIHQGEIVKRERAKTKTNKTTTTKLSANNVKFNQPRSKRVAAPMHQHTARDKRCEYFSSLRCTYSTCRPGVLRTDRNV